MYLHIGNNVIVPAEEIIAVIDGKFDDKTRQTITDAVPKGKTVRSTVLTDDAVYFSAINATTLQSRSVWQNITETL